MFRCLGSLRDPTGDQMVLTTSYRYPQNTDPTEERVYSFRLSPHTWGLLCSLFMCTWPEREQAKKRAQRTAQ